METPGWYKPRPTVNSGEEIKLNSLQQQNARIMNVTADGEPETQGSNDFARAGHRIVEVKADGKLRKRD